VVLKYPDGTCLIALKDNRGGFSNIGRNDRMVVAKSDTYTGAYKFISHNENSVISDPGWCTEYIEDPNEFILAEINNWKQHLNIIRETKQ